MNRRGTRPWNDLLLGVELALKGGRGGWARLTLIAVGVGVGVAVLLLGASVPQLLEARSERGAAVTPIYTDLHDGADTEDTLLMSAAETKFRDQQVTGHLVRPNGADAPVPPGIDALPEPGEMYASPALVEVLESSDGHLLEPRVDHDLAGVIASEGLSDSGELLYYTGSSELSPDDARVSGFGTESSGPSSLPTEVLLLLLIGVVVLILPVVMFVTVAMRFGSERRDQRLAALRLVGLSRGAVARVAAGEALVGATAGLMVGAMFFVLGTVLLERIQVMGIGVFASDAVPSAALLAVVLLGVPLLSVLMTVLSMRRVAMEPLGVIRRSAPTRRRLWWRLVLFAPGVTLLGFLALNGFTGNYRVLVVLAAMAVLLGMAMLLPWGIDVVVRRMRGGGAMTWQLATRRLQLGGGGTARVVNGIAVAVAGGIALQLLLAGVTANMTFGDPDEPSVWSVTASHDGVGVGELADRIQAVEGAQPTAVWQQTYVHDPSDDSQYLVAVAECGQLGVMADLSSCQPGDAFHSSLPKDLEGIQTELFDPRGEGGEGDTPRKWTIPPSTETVDLNPEFEMSAPIAVLVTPEAIAQEGLVAPEAVAGVELDGSVAEAPDLLRNAVEPDPVAAHIVSTPGGEVDERFAEVQLGLTLGIMVLMGLIGLSLVVSTLEQLQERRRVLSVLRAFGAKRRTLALSMVWQSAIPVVLGLLLAAGIGSLMGMMLLMMGGMTVTDTFDWTVVAGIAGASAAVVMLISLCGIPLLWRLMKDDGLRAE